MLKVVVILVNHAQLFRITLVEAHVDSCCLFFVLSRERGCFREKVLNKGDGEIVQMT